MRRRALRRLREARELRRQRRQLERVAAQVGACADRPVYARQYADLAAEIAECRATCERVDQVLRRPRGDGA